MMFSSRVVAAVCVALSIPSQESTRTPDEWHAAGVTRHLARELDAASALYDQALAADPPRRLTAGEWDRVFRFAPRVLTTTSEPFALRDVAVILHPTTGVIAYHLFWDDDIDFPDDNDPCDHEVVWVTPAPDGRGIARLDTYFHGRILTSGDAALRDAASHNGRAAVLVQWGKHGSMPLGWEEMTVVARGSETEAAYYRVDVPITLREYNVGTWRKLSTVGRRSLANPYASLEGWPQKFTGTVDEFLRFTRAVDITAPLRRHRRGVVSRWNSGPLNRWLLPYNFRPKTEWPQPDTPPR